MKRHYPRPVNTPTYWIIVLLLLAILVTSGLAGSLAVLNLIVHLDDLANAPTAMRLPQLLAQPATSFAATPGSHLAEAGYREGFAAGQLQLATRAPWPTPTATFIPWPTPTATETPMPTPTLTATASPTPLPLPTPTLVPPPPPTLAPVPPPVVAAPPRPAAPTPTLTPATTPTPSFAYNMVEVYEDYTSNQFLTGYIAIVNAQEIPIGGVKAVGVFEPGGQQHESPLSPWFFDVATAPGVVVKKGSVKFEPGGIQAGTWFIHLENEQGDRLSEDVAINTDPEVPKWFYIKFKQPTRGGF